MTATAGYLARRLAGAAEALLFPATCGGCGRLGTWLCDGCRAALRPIPWQWGLALPEMGLEIDAAYVFDGVVRRSIHHFKYRGEYQRGRFLGSLLADYAESSVGPGGRPDLVLPVPLHRRRQRERGFNQAEILAEAVAARLGVPLGRGLLRVVETRQQVGLSFAERQQNVAGAFRCEGDSLRDAAILLVDDVVTTGATMAAAARALRAVGAARVAGLALARQMPRARD